MNKVGLLIIATGKYDIFIEQLLRSVESYFFKYENVDIYLFVDKEYKIGHSLRLNIIQIPIEHKPFPYATLYRYKYFDDNKEVLTSEYLFYLDVDMRIVADIKEEILGDIVCVQHPGFYKGGWGSQNCNPKSLAYLPSGLWQDYKAGGFQGGKNENYLTACKILNVRIQNDEARGVIAEWHDETHFNWYLKMKAINIKTLSPSYCFPESAWAKDLPFEKKIIALEKNHKEIRS